MAPAKPPFDPLPTEPLLWRLRNAPKTPPPPVFHSSDLMGMIVAATAKPSRWSGAGSRQAAVAPSAVGTAALATAGRSGVARIAFKKGVRPQAARPEPSPYLSGTPPPDLHRPHLLRMPFAAPDDEPPDPLEIRLLRPQGQVAMPHHLPARVHEPQLGFGPSPSRGGRDRPSSEHSMIGCLFWLVFCRKTLKLKTKKIKLGCNRPGSAARSAAQ
jgi:hypothetical protein